jgi:hypothetical protein
MKNPKPYLILAFVFTLIIFMGCDKKDYNSFQYLNPQWKDFLPFRPGDTLTFVDTNNKKMQFIANPDQDTFYFEHTTDNGYDGEPWEDVTREIYKTQATSNDNKKLLNAEISIEDAYSSGENFGVLLISFSYEDKSVYIKLVANHFSNWLYQCDFTKYGDIEYNYDLPHLNSYYKESLILLDKSFNNVFFESYNDYAIYFTYQQGLIAIEIDGNIFLNEKYR